MSDDSISLDSSSGFSFTFGPRVENTVIVVSSSTSLSNSTDSSTSVESKLRLVSIRKRLSKMSQTETHSEHFVRGGDATVGTSGGALRAEPISQVPAGPFFFFTELVRKR